MRLATTTGDLVYYCSSPAEAVRAFEGTGFRHLDYTFWRLAWGDKPLLADNWFEPIKAAGKEAEKLGFDFVQAHSPGLNFLASDEAFEEALIANKRTIEACGYLGIDKVVVHAGTAAGVKYPDGRDKYFELNRKFYEQLYPSMEKYGVKVLVENCWLTGSEPNYYLINGQNISEFIDYCDHPLLGVCWDTGHGNIQTESIYDELMTLGDRLEALHVQDNFGEKDNHLAPYMGTLDIDSLMNALIDGGFARRGCCFTFECDSIITQYNRRTDDRFKQVSNYPGIELKRAAVAFMYQIGKKILTDYDCFED